MSPNWVCGLRLSDPGRSKDELLCPVWPAAMFGEQLPPDDPHGCGARKREAVRLRL